MTSAKGVVMSDGKTLEESFSDKADDTNVVHKSGDEEILGRKTFDDLRANGFCLSNNGDWNRWVSAFYSFLENQGVIQFGTEEDWSVILRNIADPEYENDAATKGYVDIKIGDASIPVLQYGALINNNIPSVFEREEHAIANAPIYAKILSGEVQFFAAKIGGVGLFVSRSISSNKSSFELIGLDFKNLAEILITINIDQSGLTQAVTLSKNLQSALTDTDGGYGQRVAELEKEGIASQAKLSELDKDVNGINFSPVEVSGFSPWGNNLILALDGFTMVYIPVKTGETFHLEASCTGFIRIGFTTQTPINGTPTTGYESFDKQLSKDYTPVANGYFCMGANAKITYEFSNPNPSLRQRVETLEERDVIPPFSIKESANLVNGAIFTKEGRWNWDKTWLADDAFRTSGKILVDSAKSLHIGSNINFIVIAQFNNVNSEEPSIVNDFTSSNLPAILSLGSNIKAIEISVNNYNVGVAYVGYEAFSEYTRGFAPMIDIPGSSISAIPTKLFDLPNTWKGKKYLSLGDSVSARDHWQQIVDFYLGTTHINKAVSGTSIGTYAFNREGGGESTSEMGQAVATSLIPASELQSMDLIIIASYINSAVSLGPQADLGSMDDTFISISEEAASEASSIDAYATSIIQQNFTQAARSTIEYVLKNCGKAKVLIVGDLQFAGGGNYGTTNFEWVNNKGYNRRDFAKRMGEIAAYYGLPYVNLEECGGVNALNASEYYNDNIHPNFLNYFGGDNWTECGMRHEAMPIIKAIIGM